MKKGIIIIVLTVFCIWQSNAQTGIGTTTPNPSAKLDVYATDKGFLPPRVTLTSVTDATTVPSPAVGLLVYNVGSAGLQAGYYYWNGSSWSTIATAVSPDQSVDYIQASLSANQSLSSTGNIIFNTSSGAGITLASGGFNLLANKTYKLEAALGGTSGGYAYYAWVDSANTLLSGGSIGSVMKAGSAFSDAPQDKAVVYYTPTTNMTVYLRVLTVSGGITAYAPNAGSNYSSTWATIQQVGSSAIVNPWVLSGTNVYNTTGKVGIGTTNPTVPLEVNGAVQANTLSLTNTSTGSSLIVKNGDAAATFNDNAQIRMGWAGSGAGTNQYAQLIHTRHNAGPTNNAIDFYLSDGTANNTITNGSTRAMSITSPGDVEISGKLTIGNASGNVATKVSGFVNAGTFLSMDNLKVSVTTGGSRGLSVGAVSTNFTANISAYYAMNGGVAGSAVANVSYTTTPSGAAFGWSFPSESDGSYYTIVDKTNNRMYRVIMMIGASYLNNFISIERLY